MKRLCLILAYLFLFTQTASAMPLLVGQKVVYRGTITGLRISAVDGTAFIDNLPYLYQSDFSAGEDSCAGFRTTISGNIDTIGGENDWLRGTLNNELGGHYIAHPSTPLTIGKKYTLSIKYYIPSGQTVVSGILVINGSSPPSGVTFQKTLDSSTIYTVTFTAVETTIRFYATNASGNYIIQDPGGDDVFYIKDIKISEIQPFMDGNHSIEIYDSSNRMLKGVLKAVGTGETLGSELIANGNNEAAVMTVTLTSRGGIAQSNEQANGGTYSAKFTITDTGSQYVQMDRTNERLYVIKADAYIPSGQGFSKGIQYIDTAAQEIAVFPGSTNTWVSKEIYHMAPPAAAGAGTGIRVGFLAQTGGAIGQYFYIDNFSIKQVTAPSSSGCTIVSSKGGTTYNFSYKNASFTYNASSYYVIIRAIR